MPEFSAELVFTHPPEAVFSFHLHPANVLDFIPSATAGQVVEAPDQLHPGGEAEFRFSINGISQRVRMRLVESRPPQLLIDEQIRGPFKHWRQTHHFNPTDNGGTRMTYRVDFLPPKGMLGFLITEKRILHALKQLIPYRQQRTQQLLDQRGPIPPSVQTCFGAQSDPNVES